MDPGGARRGTTEAQFALFILRDADAMVGNRG